MRVASPRNDHLPFLLGKIVLSALFITAFTLIPGILEVIFLILRYTCRIHWNVYEWRFRVSLDMYIAYVGMLSGILFVRLSDILSGEGQRRGLTQFLRNHFFAIRVTFFVAALGIIPGFWIVTRRSPDKYDYNWWNPYISCLPILSFIVIRNSSRHLRNFHSSIFAWLGRCSLETFTLQFHIWMAGDTKGLLSLGVFGRNGTQSDGRWQDFVLLTPVFLWISWHVAGATSTLTSWLIDPKEGRQEIANEELVPNSHNGFLQLSRTKSHEYIADNTAIYMKVLGDRSSSWIGIALRENLGVRLAVIMGTMWVLNLTYT